MDTEQELHLFTEQTNAFFREALPDSIGRENRLLELLTDGNGLPVCGCYHTKPAPGME